MTKQRLHIPEIQNDETDQTDVTTKKVSLYGFDASDTTKKRITGTAQGSDFGLNVSISPTENYKITDIDASGYYGYVNKDGGWYIMKGDAGAYRYIKGDSDYATAWTGRAELEYDYFDAIF